MIVLEQVAMTLPAYKQKDRVVLSPTNLVIPSDRRIALLGHSSDDNRLLIDLLGGLMMPRAGRIVRMARVSFPVGHLGGFEKKLSVRLNVAHLAGIYDADARTVIEFVERVAGIGSAFDKPFDVLPGTMRKLLGRVVAYAIPFDVYVLADGISRSRKGRGDVTRELFEARARTAGMIIPTRDPQAAREHCEMGLVLNHGELVLHDDIEKALAASQRHLERQSPKTDRRN
jgi:capsular polysaccharide transport system ATP-binding protein